jgi:hypothetical protein
MQSTRLSAKSDDQELEYPQTLANRQNSTNVNDSTVQQSDQTGTSKDMARSYGKYEKLKDTPDNLYGMFVCILFVCKLSLLNSHQFPSSFTGTILGNSQHDNSQYPDERLYPSNS